MHRLDGKHVVFGEVVDGENLLKTLELGGSQSGQPTSKFVIEDCGEVKEEEKKWVLFWLIKWWLDEWFIKLTIK